jgi:hypothetical protein
MCTHPNGDYRACSELIVFWGSTYTVVGSFFAYESSIVRLIASTLEIKSKLIIEASAHLSIPANSPLQIPILSCYFASPFFFFTLTMVV